MTIESPNRRDFLFLAPGAAGAVGVAAAAWPLIDQMNPDASTLAMASIEVDVGAVPEGQIVIVKWRGGPVFVRHRTKKEIAEAQNVDVGELRDPQTDAQRVKKPEWLIAVGVRTHLGCVPLGPTKVSTRAGSVLATARCTTPRAEFAKVPRPSISPSRNTRSSATRR